jgi:hypothetical protein
VSRSESEGGPLLQSKCVLVELVIKLAERNMENEKTERANAAFFDRPMKGLDPAQLELAIGEAVSELVESRYVADIKCLNFNPDSELNAFASDAVEIRLIVRQDLGAH